MPSQYLHSGEPLPLAPFLETGADDSNINELSVFHGKLLDYLRRLTAKLSNDQFEPPPAAGTTAVESLMLTLSTAYTLAVGSEDTIEWDEIQRKDTPYDYNASTGVITLIDAGFYVMFVNVYIPADQVHTVRLIDGAATVLPYGTGYFDQGISAVHSESYMIPFAAHAGMTVAFQVVGAASNDVEADSSRLLVIKLGAFIGSGGVDPCDGFDVWQLCP